MTEFDELVVYVIDDEESVRESVCALVESMSVATKAFPSAEEFLKQYSADWQGCIVTDVRMRGMSGVEFQQEMNSREIALPVVLLTAYARTPLTVEAMKLGAITVVDKPAEGNHLWDAIRRALSVSVERKEKQARLEELRSRLESLKPGEQQVLEGMMEGKANKVIAIDLGVSLRTVEERRKRVFQKMKTDAVATLVQLVLEIRES